MRLRLGSIAVTTALAALVVLNSLFGLDRVWHWTAAQWRLDVGAPQVTWAHDGFDRVPDVHLVIAGDVGTGSEREWETARAAADLERVDEVDALVLLGDNVYPSGDPARLDATVFDPFADLLDGPTQLVAALGNHDVENGYGDEQMAALGMPGRWYTTVVGSVTIVVVDSTRPADPDQLAWLDRTLSGIDSVWTVVAMHHAPYSAGYHGSDAASREHLVPLFERYGVDLVLSGHEHDYQRMIPVNGVSYLVSGAAAKTRSTSAGRHTAFAASTRHVVELAAYEDRLEVRAVDKDGRVFDAFALAADSY